MKRFIIFDGETGFVPGGRPHKYHDLPQIVTDVILFLWHAFCFAVGFFGIQILLGVIDGIWYILRIKLGF